MVIKATAAHQRAVEHLQKCKGELTIFDDLEGAPATHTADALRDAGPVDLPDTLREKILVRKRARDVVRWRRCGCGQVAAPGTAAGVRTSDNELVGPGGSEGNSTRPASGAHS
jgi:hypothetical protein